MSALLSAENLTIRIGPNAIVENVSLSFAPGRFVALIGPNGAGKTTLLKALAGLITTEGVVMFRDRPMDAIPGRERARCIAYLPQGHQVYWPLLARDVVALGRYPHGLADPSRLTADHARAIHSAMTRTDTTHLADQPVQTLSGGERARVMLARVMAVEAPVLLADEPTASLDPGHQISVMRDLKAESRRGTLVIAVTHDLGLAARLADEIVLLDRGRLIAQGSPDTVLTDENLHAVYQVSVLRQMIDGEMFLTPRAPL
ncbi:MAG: ABC transporter ATP-binding protein [Rhizobiales bacterium]|nr:ABC transporter ATP-binding protein [Hyphomicrobiales bacterium]